MRRRRRRCACTAQAGVQTPSPRCRDGARKRRSPARSNRRRRSPGDGSPAGPAATGPHRPGTQRHHARVLRRAALGTRGRPPVAISNCSNCSRCPSLSVTICCSASMDSARSGRRQSIFSSATVCSLNSRLRELRHPAAPLSTAAAARKIVGFVADNRQPAAVTAIAQRLGRPAAGTPPPTITMPACSGRFITPPPFMLAARVVIDAALYRPFGEGDQ